MIMAAVSTWHEYVPAGIATAEAYACRDGIFRWAAEDLFFDKGAVEELSRISLLKLIERGAVDYFVI